MSMTSIALPKMFEAASFSMWLPGEWPCWDDFKSAWNEKPRQSWQTLDRYLREREKWIRLVKDTLRSSAVPLLKSHVFLAFVHRRVRYVVSDRMSYSYMAERLILPALLSSGAFREDMIQGVTHVFEQGDEAGAGIGVLVAEQQRAEASPRRRPKRQGMLPGMDGGRTRR
jgi:hypothetical protein